MAESTRAHAQDPHDQVLRSNSAGQGSASDMATDISSLELFTNQLGPFGDINDLNAFLGADNFPRSVTSALSCVMKSLRRFSVANSIIICPVQTIRIRNWQPLKTSI